jgi:hypothetical protein
MSVEAVLDGRGRGMKRKGRDALANAFTNTVAEFYRLVYGVISQ